ncbi:MAG: hypothetical protein ACRDBP_05260 [Luteolibacter sp.]
MKEAWHMAVERMPVWAAVVLLACQFGAPLFHFWQNHPPQRLGGPISRAKAGWLIHVAILWLALPALLATQHPAYAWLAASMGLRTLIELPLCATQRWSTNHGLSHDVIHAAIALYWLPRVPPDLRLWIVLTLVTLAAEVFFVLRFRKSTAGPAHGIYFVPDGPAHARLNLVTDLIRMPSQLIMVSILIAACLK